MGVEIHPIVSQIIAKFDDRTGFTDLEKDLARAGHYTISKINGKYFVDTFVPEHQSSGQSSLSVN